MLAGQINAVGELTETEAAICRVKEREIVAFLSPARAA